MNSSTSAYWDPVLLKTQTTEINYMSIQLTSVTCVYEISAFWLNITRMNLKLIETQLQESQIKTSNNKVEEIHPPVKLVITKWLNAIKIKQRSIFLVEKRGCHFTFKN